MALARTFLKSERLGDCRCCVGAPLNRLVWLLRRWIVKCGSMNEVSDGCEGLECQVDVEGWNVR